MSDINDATTDEDIQSVLSFFDSEELSDFYEEKDEIMAIASTSPSQQIYSSSSMKRSLDSFEEVSKSKKNREKVCHISNRLEYLINFPILLQGIVNAGDEVQLRELVYDAFSQNCSFKTDATPVELIGRNNFVDFFISIFRTTPDFVMLNKPAKLNGRVITTKSTSLGTNIIDDPMDYLYHHYKHNTEELNEDEKMKYEKLHKERKNDKIQVSFRTKSLGHFILNEEMTHIEHYISRVKQVTMNEVKKSIA